MTMHNVNAAIVNVTEVDTADGPIPAICKPLRVVGMAVLGRNGVLMDANRGFIDLLPNTMPASQLLDLRYLFIHPRFDQFAARRADRAGGIIYDDVINFGDFRAEVVSLHATIYEHGHDLLLVVEHDLARLQELNAKLMEVNAQLAEKQRELARANRQLQHHRSQGEGALKDRDALMDLLSSDNKKGPSE